MATYTKFNTFVEYLSGGVMDLFGTAGSGADTCNVTLSNTAPTASTDDTLSDITQIAGTNISPSLTQSIANVGTRTTTTVTVNGTNVTYTASGGAVAAFQYIILYDDTPTSPADPLIAYWNYGSALTLNDGDSFTIKFNNGASNGTVFTLA